VPSVILDESASCTNVVVLGHRSRSLEHLNQHRLVVSVGEESLALLGGNSDLALDQGSHHSPSNLNSKKSHKSPVNLLARSQAVLKRRRAL
jgi:hypothetical protein